MKKNIYNKHHCSFFNIFFTILCILAFCLIFIKVNMTNSDVKKIERKEVEVSKIKSYDELLEDEVNKTINNMSISEKVLQLFVVTLEQLTDYNKVIRAEEVTKTALQNYPVGGIILFSDNIINEKQLRTMISNIKSYSKYPIFISVDEEGGNLVSRVSKNKEIDVKKFPDMSEIGKTKDFSKAYEVGNEIGKYLYNFGFNLDFAPVADIYSENYNKLIEKRSFGKDKKIVAGMVSNVIQGLQKNNISSCIKHFPGHGDTKEDSHKEKAISYKTLKELRKEELVPFKAGIEQGVDMVMVGHISFPNILEDDKPATFDETIINGLLRGELSYDGIVISDSMSMDAIKKYYSTKDIAIEFIKAGGDIILMPNDFKNTYAELLNAVNTGEISEERINESLRRIFKVKIKRKI